MKIQNLAVFCALAGAVAATEGCSDNCSNDALCCCCQTTHTIPGESGFVDIINSEHARCMGQTCDTVCSSWVADSKSTCPEFNDPAGFPACDSVGEPSSSPNSKFRFWPNGNVAGGWAWESSDIAGIVLNSNGLLAWEIEGNAYKINVVCVSVQNNQLTDCYKRPQYSACRLIDGEYRDISNVKAYA